MEKYRIDRTKGMEIGLYSLGDHIANPATKKLMSNQQRIQEIIELAKFAEDAGLDIMSLGESHQEHFTTQAHTVILGAIAQATSKIKLASSATVVSVHDPVLLYEDSATIDLISNGRYEIIGGRGSRVGAYYLLGYNVRDYEELFEEKFELLNLINDMNGPITWEGQFRAPLEEAVVIPRPLNGSLPIWRAVGGPAESAIKAGLQGVPMALTTLAGPATAFKPASDAYREALKYAGHDPADFPMATTSLAYVADTTKEAMQKMYPYLNAGWEAIRGGGWPKQTFAQASSYRDTLMVGEPSLIVDKLLYQYEMYGMQRFLAQIDFGGIELDELKKVVELLATKVLPEVKKYTAEKETEKVAK